MEKEIIISQLDSQRIKDTLAKTTHDSLMLYNEIQKAIVVNSEEIPSDVVTMNSVVQFILLNKPHLNKKMQIQIVYPEEADIKQNRISIFAPIAIALLGYKVGDIVAWNVPIGRVQLKIIDIIYQPEASGDFHL